MIAVAMCPLDVQGGGIYRDPTTVLIFLNITVNGN